MVDHTQYSTVSNELRTAAPVNKDDARFLRVPGKLFPVTTLPSDVLRRKGAAAANLPAEPNWFPDAPRSRLREYLAHHQKSLQK